MIVAGYDCFDFGEQIARHLHRGDISECDEGKTDDVLVRVVEVIFERVGDENLRELMLVCLADPEEGGGPGGYSSKRLRDDYTHKDSVLRIMRSSKASRRLTQCRVYEKTT